MDFLHDCAALVFDMDGLLLDTERLSRQALHAAADDLGIPLPQDAFLELIGRRLRDIHQRLVARLGDEALTSRLIARSEEHYEIYLAQEVPLKEGAADLLEWFAARQRPLAVATSTSTAKAERKLTTAGLRKHFSAIIGGEQVAHGKPAPDVYLRAAEMLGVAAAHCGVFEDSEPGLRAAHAAGARVVWIPDLAPVTPEARALATAQAASLREVLNFLNQGERKTHTHIRGV